MNILIYLCILIISMLSIYFSKKIIGKLGLIMTLITSSILSLILSFKFVTLLTLNLTASSIAYVTMHTSLYLLLESVSQDEVKKITKLNFAITIFSSIILYIMSYHVQSLTDTISINMRNVFIDNNRILITFPLAMLISNYLLIIMYKKIRKLYDVPFITTVTTFLLIGLIEGIIFFFTTYYQVLETKIIIKLLLSSYMIKLIITIIYSIFLTLLTSKKVKK